jgi:hypothetical protein
MKISGLELFKVILYVIFLKESSIYTILYNEEKVKQNEKAQTQIVTQLLTKE